MPKYSFKRNLFFALLGGVTNSGLLTTPHIHYVGHTTHCVSCTAHFVGRTAHCVSRTLHPVSHTEYYKKHSVNIKF